MDFTFLEASHQKKIRNNTTIIIPSQECIPIQIKRKLLVQKLIQNYENDNCFMLTIFRLAHSILFLNRIINIRTYT